MSDPEPQSRSGLPPNVLLILAIGLLVLLGYEAYKGVVFKEFDLGPFKIVLGSPSPEPSESAAPVAAQSPVATREFLIGRWRGRTEEARAWLKDGNLLGPDPEDVTTTIDVVEEYYADGSWSGELTAKYMTDFFQKPGQPKVQASMSTKRHGQWYFTALDDHKFHVTVNFKQSETESWTMSDDFGIRDNDHIHNIKNRRNNGTRRPVVFLSAIGYQ
jgi:hypothetical protein